MFKKKIKEEKNVYDENMRKLRDELAEIGWNMDSKIKQAYIKAKAVMVYPEHSPDWEQAIQDRNKAQELVHCSIGMYDSKRAEILQFMEKYGDKMCEPWSKTLTSHEWVEREIKRIVEK